jgi:hypothetical protein
VIQRLVKLAGASLVFWLLTAVPARYLGGGERAVLVSATAMLICLVPAGLTMTWVNWSLDRFPEQQVAIVLGGTGVRMICVLVAGLALASGLPFLQGRQDFWVWVLVAYLFTLALEVGLTLAGRTGNVDRPRAL